MLGDDDTFVFLTSSNADGPWMADGRVTPVIPGLCDRTSRYRSPGSPPLASTTMTMFKK